MGQLRDELGKRRWAGGGLMLVALLSVLLLAPVWRNRDIDHPLSAAQGLDLCPLLPVPPAPFDVAGRRGPATIAEGSICTLKLPDGAGFLRVSLVSTRDASSGGGAQRTRKVFDTWLKEVIVSGASEVREQPGAWAMASSYRLGNDHQMLVEDHGVMLVLVSNRLDADALSAYARAVQTALRTRS
jgi:hypothetical protein